MFVSPIVFRHLSREFGHQLNRSRKCNTWTDIPIWLSTSRWLIARRSGLYKNTSLTGAKTVILALLSCIYAVETKSRYTLSKLNRDIRRRKWIEKDSQQKSQRYPIQNYVDRFSLFGSSLFRTKYFRQISACSLLLNQNDNPKAHALYCVRDSDGRALGSFSLNWFQFSRIVCITLVVLHAGFLEDIMVSYLHALAHITLWISLLFR